ncbi:MAG: winged helix-turn-helix domain-containing protein [Parabacteroides johnsonii]
MKTKLYTEAKSVSSWISQTFGIHYTVQGCVSLLNRMGFTYKKTSEIPCEADHDRQEEFMKELSGARRRKTLRALSITRMACILPIIAVPRMLGSRKRKSFLSRS